MPRRHPRSTRRRAPSARSRSRARAPATPPPPDVAITSPGVTPTTAAAATAVVSPGVVTSIAVVEPGFGFVKPAVTLTGGNPTPGFEATAVASGGVDNITVTHGGTGYTMQPMVRILAPGPPRRHACGGDGRTDRGRRQRDHRGHGRARDTRPPRRSRSSTRARRHLADPATADATIGIAAIDLTPSGTPPTVGGQGYDSPPVVTITDVVDPLVPGRPRRHRHGDSRGQGCRHRRHRHHTRRRVPHPGPEEVRGHAAGSRRRTAANDLGQYIPVAVPDTTTYPGTDYYEIAVVQYREKFHSDLQRRPCCAATSSSRPRSCLETSWSH